MSRTIKVTIKKGPKAQVSGSSSLSFPELVQCHDIKLPLLCLLALRKRWARQGDPQYVDYRIPKVEGPGAESKGRRSLLLF